MEIHFKKICQLNCEHMEIVVSIWVKKEQKILLHLIEWNKKELTQTMESIIKKLKN